MIEEYGNIELQEIIDRIADMSDMLYYDKNTIIFACICGANNYNNRGNYENDYYENENYENNNYYTAKAGYYKNYYENERLSINNTL